MEKSAFADYLRKNCSPEEIALIVKKYKRDEGYEKYANDPVGFARDVLHLHLWSKQREILKALCGYRARVSARSCHGIGKTLVSAVAALWFLYAHKPARVVITATKQDQLKLGVFYEIKRLHALSNLGGQCDTLKLQLSTDQIAIGQTARDATSFQGQHCEHILVIVDESAGVSEEIFTGVDALLTSEDARLLLLGNPTSSSGRFYDSHHTHRHLYTTFAVSAFETPAWTGEDVPEIVLRNLINKEWVDEKTEIWGTESPLYLARVLGQFPTQGSGSLIDIQWLEDAADAAVETEAPIEFGVDVARLGECETVVCVRRGATILHLEAWQGQRTTYTEGRIIQLAREYSPRIIRIDDGGVGGGPVDHLLGEGLPVLPVNAGSRSSKPETYCLLRDEVWWNVREKLRLGEIKSLTDKHTQAQLSAIKYTTDSRGRIKVEGKKEMMKRGVKSPDRADALCLAFYDGQRHAAAPIHEYEPELDW